MHGGKRPKAGRKIKFTDSKHIVQREASRRHYQKTKTSDEELEFKLQEKFKKEGWDLGANKIHS